MNDMTRVVMDEYVIDVKVRKKTSKCARKEDAYSFLNKIAYYLFEARTELKSGGYDAIAKEAFDMAIAIMNTLEAKGYYDTKEETK